MPRPRDRDDRLSLWRELVRARLPELPVESARRSEIEDELAQWLRDASERAGVDPADGEAFETWLAGEVPAWEDLADSLAAADHPALGRRRARGWALRSRARMTAGLLGDLRFALRSVRRSPGFSIVAILTLAVGIGLNSAVFSLLNSVFLKPLPIAGENELVRIYSHEPRSFLEHEPMAYPDYEDLSTEVAGLEGVGAFAMSFMALETEDRAEIVFGEMVTGSFFPVLGARAARGRLIGPDDDRAASPAPVAVLSYASWRSRFGGDESVVGRVIRVNGAPLTVIGVAPAGFKSLFRGLETEVWLPLHTAETLGATPAQSAGVLHRGESRFSQRASRWLWVVGRLTPGADFAQAAAEIEAFGAGLEEQYPDSNEHRSFLTVHQRDVKMVPGLDTGLTAASSVLFAVVALVLLIACANLANLLLARALGRQREMATRLSLGAGTATLVRQLLLEGLLLAGAGAVAGLGIAAAANALVSRIRLPLVVPLGVTVSLDARVVAFTLLLAVGATLLFGLVPALQAARPDLAIVLREEGGSRGGSAKRRRLQGALVVAQVALSVILLAFGGLSLRSALNARDVDLGFDPEGRVSMTLTPALQGYDEARVAQFFPALRRELESVPGVAAVTASSHLPLTLWINTTNVIADGREALPVEEWPDVDHASVDDAYFEAMGIEMVAGRAFEPVECREKRRVVIVNETLAREFWPGESALGKRVRMGPGDEPREVVGIAANGRYRTLGEPPRPFIYLPVPDDWDTRVVVVRFRRPEQASPRPLVAAVHGLDEHLAISGLGPVSEQIQTVLFLPRAGAAVFGALGGLGLFLAGLGLYGVLAYAVGQRTHEIGLRVAMGADRADILALVVRQGLVLTGLGAALGLLGALASTRVLAAILYGVSPTDALTFAAVVGVLLAIATVAALVPARRAMRLDPIHALRYE